MIGIQAVVHMATDAPEKFPYGCLIVGMVIIYKLVQCRIDVIKSKFGKQDLNELNEVNTNGKEKV
jgi:hypothetical protein